MRLQSSAVRFAYNRLKENYSNKIPWGEKLAVFIEFKKDPSDSS
jgi:hypothetical protein